jgi:hypothetical protein
MRSARQFTLRLPSPLEELRDGQGRVPGMPVGCCNNEETAGPGPPLPVEDCG